MAIDSKHKKQTHWMTKAVFFMLLDLVDLGYSSFQIASNLGCSDSFVRMVKAGKRRKEDIAEWRSLRQKQEKGKEPIVILRSDE